MVLPCMVSVHMVVVSCLACYITLACQSKVWRAIVIDVCHMCWLGTDVQQEHMSVKIVSRFWSGLREYAAQNKAGNPPPHPHPIMEKWYWPGMGRGCNQWQPQLVGIPPTHNLTSTSTLDYSKKQQQQQLKSYWGMVIINWCIYASCHVTLQHLVCCTSVLQGNSQNSRATTVKGGLGHIL